MHHYSRRQFARRLTGLATAGWAASLPLGQAFAQGSGKPLTIVVPFAPAGTTDMLGRMVAQRLGPVLGRTVIVENKPGAGTGIGAAYVARAPADGDTLLLATSTKAVPSSSVAGSSRRSSSFRSGRSSSVASRHSRSFAGSNRRSSRFRSSRGNSRSSGFRSSFFRSWSRLTTTSSQEQRHQSSGQ